MWIDRNPIALAALLLFSISASAADWPFFRGPGRDGKSPETSVPLNWSSQHNIKWKVKLPRPGNSSPIVIGDHVFISCAEDAQGTRRSLYCFARADGKVLWARTVNFGQIEKTHEANPFCGSTPASDGQRVVVWHGSAGQFCYDLSGNELWHKDLGAFHHIWGYASSPIIHGDKVYLNCGPGARSFVVALKLSDGAVAWQTDEPGQADDQSPVTKSWIGSWSSGLVATVGRREELLVFQARHVNAYDLDNGKILWTCGGAGDLAYTDVMVSPQAQIGLALAGYGGAGFGFKLGGEGDTTSTNQLWRQSQRIPQRIGTGVIIGPNAFIPNEPGSISCIDIATGKERWSHRLPGQNLWSSIVATPNRLYATSQRGTTFVFAPDPDHWKLLATNDLDEHTNATPALSNGQIFIRTWEHLWCVGE